MSNCRAWAFALCLGLQLVKQLVGLCRNDFVTLHTSEYRRVLGSPSVALLRTSMALFVRFLWSYVTSPEPDVRVPVCLMRS